MLRLVLPILFALLLSADARAQAEAERPSAPAERAVVEDSVAESPAPSLPDVAPDTAPSPTDKAPIFYVVGERPRVYARPDSGVALDRLAFRQEVRVIERRDGWSRVLAGDLLGWVADEALSNVWVLMEKGTRTLTVYRGTEVLRTLPADVSQNPEDDKVRRAELGEREHYRIPEGTFYITSKNLQSEYYRSLMLSYPGPEDAARGLEAGLISQREYDAIVRAAETFASPPMGTRLGGAIAIHGQGSGKRRAWTRGCIALRDVHMDAIWDLVGVGTPVLIR